jgi:hypothetical protein
MIRSLNYFQHNMIKYDISYNDMIKQYIYVLLLKMQIRTFVLIQLNFLDLLI